MEAVSTLAGWQIMDFWDRLCTGLRARKVTLSDISQKRSMKLRLLHGVAFSEPWFGLSGYKIGFIDVTIQGMPQCIFAHYPGNSNIIIFRSLIFSTYQTLSDHSLVTLGDLFRFMLDLETHLSASGKLWSPKRVEMATRVIMLGCAARAYIDDTGLLDLELKSLGNHVVGNYLVRRCLNPVTKLKRKLRKFRELYWGLRSFIVESVMNLNLIYESGVNRRDVDCACGAKEDDGERMVSCGICEDRQHSRCVRIQNNQEMPPLFLCCCCENEIIILSSVP
uniref:PTC1-like winged helix-turn-helix domain-containing protein n=1 Tax=Populus trichocarpa TaxID=3694 RepID=B9HJL3_POPTR